MKEPGAVFLFAGPTLVRARHIYPELDIHATVLPPARRGDIGRLVRSRAPSTIVLVDGLFHQALAVGHRELREALDAEWSVWGLSSMGAIRACEMSSLGMRGFGDVFTRFVEEKLRDDEVTLLHGPAPRFDELSEPLVHLRQALADLVARHVLSAAQAAEIADELATMYFGDRTLGRFAELIRRVAPAATPLDRFDDYRLKSHDLIRFARDQPYRA